MNDKREETRQDTVKNLYDVYGTDKPGYSTITNLYGVDSKKYGVDSKKDLFEELDKDPDLTYSDLYLLTGDLESAVKAFDFLLKKHKMTKEDLEGYIKYKRGQLGIDNKESKISDNKEKEKVDSTEKSDVQENPEKDTGVEDKPEAETVDGSELQKINDLIKDDPLANLTLDVNHKRNELVKNKSPSMPNVETKNDSTNDWKELLAMIEDYGLQLKEIEDEINKTDDDPNISEFIKEVKLENLRIRQTSISQCINICLQAAQKIKGSLNNDELDDYKVKGKINVEPLGEKTKKIRVDNEGKTIADSINNGDINDWHIPSTLEELRASSGTEPEKSEKVRLIDELRNLKIVKKIKNAIDFIREKATRNKNQSSRDTAELSEEQAEDIKMGAMESAGTSVEDNQIEIPEENIDLQSVEESAKSR